MKTLVLLSGGLDSCVLLADVLTESKAEDILCLTFDYGSKHNVREYKSAEAIAYYYGVKLIKIELDFIHKHFKSDLLKGSGAVPEGHYQADNMRSTVVPFRNGIMLSIAAGIAESFDCKKIAIANHFGDHEIYPDCRSSFIEPFTEAIKQGTYQNIILYSPFCSKTKDEIVEIGNALYAPLHLTYSCYNGREHHCGKCGTCVERIEAFNLSAIKDPTIYEINS